MAETRLRLRPWRSTDLPALTAILGDPDVMEFSDKGVLSLAEQALWLDAAMAFDVSSGLPGPRAIEQGRDGRVIGYVSLSCDPRRIKESEAELGIRLAKSAWGQGFALKAAQEILKALPGDRGPQRIVAIVDPHNLRSVRLLKRIGMSYEREILFDGYDYPDHLYACAR